MFMDRKTQHYQNVSSSQLVTYVIREMQIKTLRCTPIGMAITCNTDTTKFSKGCRTTEALTRCWCQCNMVQPLLNSLVVSSRIKHTLTM